MTIPALLMTGFGLGRLRPAPGTWGSLPPPLLALAIVAAGAGGRVVDLAMVGLGLVFAVTCVALGPWAERTFGRKDPSAVVADEIAGQAIPLLALPWRSFGEPDGTAWNLALAGTAFVSFRVFDIWKPPPANKLQSLPAGWGILVDDLIAGVYALALTQLAVRFMWPGVL